MNSPSEKKNRLVNSSTDSTVRIPQDLIILLNKCTHTSTYTNSQMKWCKLKLEKSGINFVCLLSLSYFANN